MAIVWDSTKCKPPEPQNNDEAAQRSALVIVGSSLGLSRVTKENVPEWFVRMRVWERRCSVEPGAWFRGADLLSVLCRWVGLTVNVETMPRNEWLSTFQYDAVEDAVQEFNAAYAAMNQAVVAADEGGAYVACEDGDTLYLHWN